MKLTKLLILFLLLSLKGFSQEAVLTSSGQKVVLNYLSSLGGTISGTLTTKAGINNTGTITNTGALINNGNLTVNGNGSITGTLTLPSLSASTLLGTNVSNGVASGNLSGDITTSGFTATLSNSGVTVGTYGSPNAVPQITVDSKGRITTITTTAITASGGSTITYTIGLNPELGGYVFYVTPNGMHGLVAETRDQSFNSNWDNAQNVISTPANHSTDGKNFTDWRLPTRYELNLMYNARLAIGGFASYNVSVLASYYWSSTGWGDNGYGAWHQPAHYGYENFFNKSYELSVRAIRDF